MSKLTIDLTKVLGTSSTFCRTTNVLSQALVKKAEYREVWNISVLSFAIGKAKQGKVGSMTRNTLAAVEELLTLGYVSQNTFHQLNRWTQGRLECKGEWCFDASNLIWGLVIKL